MLYSHKARFLTCIVKEFIKQIATIPQQIKSTQEEKAKQIINDIYVWDLMKPYILHMKRRLTTSIINTYKIGICIQIIISTVTTFIREKTTIKDKCPANTIKFK